MIAERSIYGVLDPKRPKARGLVQHGGPPDWLEERDQAVCDFLRDGRSMPPALADQIHLLRFWG